MCVVHAAVPWWLHGTPLLREGRTAPAQTELYCVIRFLWNSIFQNIVIDIHQYLRHWSSIDWISVISETEYRSWVVLSMRPCTPMLDPGKGSPRPDKWCLTGSSLGLGRGHHAENDVSLSLNHQLFIQIHRQNCEDATKIMSRSDVPSASLSCPNHHKKSLSHFLLQRQSVMKLFKWESR